MRMACVNQEKIFSLKSFDFNFDKIGILFGLIYQSLMLKTFFEKLGDIKMRRFQPSSKNIRKIIYEYITFNTYRY